MKPLTNSIKKTVLIIITLFSFIDAFSIDRDIFLKKYIDDPYSRLKTSDICNSGNLVWNYQGAPLTFLAVYYQEIKWNIGANGRSDLIIPVSYSTDPSLLVSKTVYLIFHNDEKINSVNTNSGVVLQHWNPKPEMQTYDRPNISYSANSVIVNQRYNVTTPGAVLPPVANISFNADLNGDGLTDAGIISLSTTNPSFNGVLFNFNTVLINTGYGMVAENDIPEMIRDLRFGFIASYANTLFNNSDSSRQKIMSKDIEISFGNQVFSKSNTVVSEPLEIDFDIANRQAFFPNLYYYNIGIKIGIEYASVIVSEAERYKQLINAYKSKVNGFIDNHNETEINQFISDVSQISVANSKSTIISFNQLPAFNFELFTPRRINDKYDLILRNMGKSIVPNVQLKQLLLKLNDNVVANGSIANEKIYNSSRVIGTCLAFMNLMNMRTTSDYLDNFLNSTSVNDFNNSLASNNNGTLRNLANSVLDLTQISTTDFILASISSGYSDLSKMVLNDMNQASFIKGYKQAQFDDLQKLKSYFGSQIPNLINAATIDEAITSVGTFINRQAVEITRLNNIIVGLQNTVTNLNNLLTNANNLVSQLQLTNQDLRNTINKIGNTADAATGFLKAGTGFIIGGPIGAAICYFFC